jgi:hypothetical protein
MKANGKRYSGIWTAFLGIAAAGCLLATAAQADPLFRGNFQLQNKVHWGSATLEPGAYSLELDQPTRTIVVRDADGKIVARAFSRTNENDRSDSKLLIAVQGDERAVYGLTIAGIGSVYQRAYPFAGIREQEARNTEGVRVEVAKK